MVAVFPWLRWPFLVGNLSCDLSCDLSDDLSSNLSRGSGSPSEQTPLDLLSNVLIWIRPDSDFVVFNGADAAEILNRGTLGGSADAPAAMNEPLWNAADANFNGKPTVTFNGTTDLYTLPSLAALTEGEVFLVRKNRIDPPVSGGSAGLWRMTDSGEDSNVPWTDTNIYESFGMVSSYRTLAHPGPSFATTHLYNTRSASADWSAWVNNVSLGSFGTNTPSFPAVPLIGRSNGAYYLDGELAELVICGTVQAAPARAAYLAYLSRFGLSL